MTIVGGEYTTTGGGWPMWTFTLTWARAGVVKSPNNSIEPRIIPHFVLIIRVTPLSLDIQASLTRIHAIGNRRSTPAGLRDKPLRPNMRYLAIKFVAGRESSRPVIPMSVIRESDFLVVLNLWLFHVRKSVFHVRI